MQLFECEQLQLQAMRHGRTSLGWAARGSIAGIAPAYQGQNTE